MESTFAQAGQNSTQTPNKVSFGQTVLFLALFCGALVLSISALQFVISWIMAYFEGGVLATSLAVIVGVVGYTISVLSSVAISSKISHYTFKFFNWVTGN